MELSFGATIPAVPFSSPAVTSDGMVVVGADNGMVYALNGTTGALIWSFNAGSAIGASPAVGSNGLVFVGTRNGVLHVLRSEATTVASVWSTTLNGGVSSAALTENSLFVGTFSNVLYAFDLQTDVVAQLRWSLPLLGRVASSPILSRDGQLYVTTYDDGSLHAVNVTTGALQWTFDAQGMVYGSPAVGSNGRVYFGDALGNFYAINPAAYGTANANPVAWSKRADSGFYSSPAIVNGSVLVASNRSVLYAYEDSLTGLDAVSVWPAFGRSNRRDAALTRSVPTNDVAVSFVGKGDFESATSQVRFEVLVENKGSLPLSSVMLQLTYPYDVVTSLSLVSIANPAGTCSIDGESCIVDALGAGASTKLSVVMTQPAKQKGWYQVEATIPDMESSVANNLARKQFGGSLGAFMLVLLGLLMFRRATRQVV
jgi:outer membrane protein assembly factor BamB